MEGYAATRDFSEVILCECINVVRNAKIGAGKMLKFDTIMSGPRQVVQCYLGCDGIGSLPCVYLMAYVVGCEVDRICDPELDEQTFIMALGPEVRSIVRRQPTISELVNEVVKSSEPRGGNGQPRQGISGLEIGMETWFKAPLTSVGRDIDFQHLPDVTVNNTHSSRKPMPVPSGSRKRKNTFEDSFSDIEIDDLDLDEDDLKQLEQIESPNKLPNGKYKCNHLCKDRTK
jgi:hypothetical protein